MYLCRFRRLLEVAARFHVTCVELFVKFTHFRAGLEAPRDWKPHSFSPIMLKSNFEALFGE